MTKIYDLIICQISKLSCSQCSWHLWLHTSWRQKLSLVYYNEFENGTCKRQCYLLMSNTKQIQASNRTWQTLPIFLMGYYPSALFYQTVYVFLSNTRLQGTVIHRTSSVCLINYWLTINTDIEFFPSISLG